MRELKDEQQRIEIEHEEHTKADKSFHLHAGLVLDVARRASDILAESSDTPRKRAFLKLLLQNPTVSGKNLDFSLAKPFEVALKFADNPVRLPPLDEFRTSDWARLALEMKMFSPALTY